ncbi:MAG: hypothetical protein JXD18_08805 [Anaerolineae bacterium]|nr:hypothetical protein [Anaerolineae bacterium]
MDQSPPLSSVDLRRVLANLFDQEELRTLCFDLEVDYDSLRGEGHAAKARELVALAERFGRLAELEAALRRERPNLDTTYSPERVQELQASIIAGSRPRVRDDFIEFTQQIEAYLNAFNLLHRQLEEWKEVHNLLQDLQNSFAPCRSYVFTLGRAGGPQADPHQRERALYEVEVEWRPCKRTLQKLQQQAASLQFTDVPYDPSSGNGPDWFVMPQQAATEIDRALFAEDILALTEQLSIFGDQVDQYLYLVDKALRDVVSDINRLPRPGSYTVRS